MDDDPNLSMKLLIDHKARSVLFAEAGKDVVDFLFNILSLPLGAVASYQINPKDMVWSIGNLYQGVDDLNDLHMISNKNVDFLMNPVVITCRTTTTNSNLPLMLLSTDHSDQSSSTKKSYYKCPNFGYSNCRTYVTLDPKSVCPYCSMRMSSPLTLVSPTKEQSSSSSSFESDFVKGGVSYMIMDDLVVKPMSSISRITLFNRLNLKEVDALEEKTVNLTFDKVGKLLRASLQTKKVLTNVFFEEKMVVEGNKSLESVE